MAGERLVPGPLGIYSYWTPGSSGWNDEHDPDTRTLGIMAQCVAESRTTSLPGSPVDNTVYIIPSGDANGNDIAARDSVDGWVNFTPSEGIVAYVKDEDAFVVFDGTDWVSLVDTNPKLTVNTQTASYTLVLADGKNTYVRMNVASANDLTVPPNASVAFPVGTVVTGRSVGAGQTTIVAGVGVTINAPNGGTLVLTGQHSAFTLVKVAADEWDLTGDVEAV